MKRNRILSLLLTLVLLLSLAPSGLAAATPYTYVALGDSIAAGYGLTNASHSYPVRVAGLIGATNTYNLAQSGMSAAQVLAQLQDPDVAAKVASANLITVSAGCADVLGAFLQLVQTAAGTSDYMAIAQDSAKLAAVAQALQSAQGKAQLAQAVQQAAVTLPQIALAIRQLNPSAKLVFTNAYDPYDGIVIPGAVPLDLGAVSGPLVLALNQAMAQGLSGVTVVDVYSAFRAPGAPRCVNATLAPPVSLDPHPNAAGHGLIAELIHRAVGSAFPAIKEPARVGTLTKRLNVCKKEGKGKLCELPKGSSVVIFSWNDRYAKIGWNNGYAYVRMDGLALYPLLGKPTRRVNAKYKLPVRETASQKGAKIGTVYAKNQLVSYGTQGKWTRVQLAGRYGFVETRYVTKAK